jgi:uncharacterized protein with PIN domain
VRIRLYLDEDAMDRALVAALRVRGVDVMTPRDAGMMEASDATQLAFVASQQRVLVTRNTSDFCRLHREWLSVGREHSGIVCMKQQQEALGIQLRSLLRLVNSMSAELMRNRLEFLSNWFE